GPAFGVHSGKRGERREIPPRSAQAADSDKRKKPLSGLPAKDVHVLDVFENAEIFLQPLKRGSRGVYSTLKIIGALRPVRLASNRSQKSLDPADIGPSVEQEKGLGPVIDD